MVEDYLGQGLRLTLRQLYYQLVVRNAIPNQERSYKRRASLVSDARLAGRMSWEAIEDHIRKPLSPHEYANLQQLMDAALYSYRLPRWAGQEYYVELWVEKDALAGVLAPIADDLHVTLMVNRGYSSQSAMYESSLRFAEAGKQNVLLYLGDFDPSGEDMVRDIQDRMEMFEVSVDVQKVALTMEQVRQYSPPPNPAKVTDPRAGAFISRHGHSSWEVDALPPEVLAKIVRRVIASRLDEGQMEDVKELEERDKKALQKAVAGIRGSDRQL